MISRGVHLLMKWNNRSTGLWWRQLAVLERSLDAGANSSHPQCALGPETYVYCTPAGILTGLWCVQLAVLKRLLDAGALLAPFVN